MVNSEDQLFAAVVSHGSVADTGAFVVCGGLTDAGIGVEIAGAAAGVDVLDRLKTLDAKSPILYFKFTVSFISSVIQT